MTITYAQLFCTVKDILADLETPGGSEARWYEAICGASDVLAKEIGHFIPVTDTKKFHGRGGLRLFIHPLLTVTSIINEETTLTTADYLSHPDNRHWPNGPYSWLEVSSDATLLSVWEDESNGVEIAGRWGKYERTAALTAVASAQLIGATTLTVDDGSQVSPGMVLKHESEQELVTGWSTPTAAVTTLDGTLAQGAEEVNVNDGTKAKIGETVRMGFEQVRVRDIQTNKWLVARGWNGTANVQHADDLAVDVYRTVTVERGVNGTTAAAHAGSLTLSRYLVPDDIRDLTREAAILKMNKARSGYAGKSGNEQTGVVFYNDEFPERELTRLKNLYSIPRTR
jgi:hypothetical protein